MNTKGQLLLVSGLLMSITLIAVSSTITHSVNLGKHQGERHDLTPQISGIESHFPLALEHQILQDDGAIPLSETFDKVSENFEDKPVEIINGFFVVAIFFIKGRSVISKDAIL